MVPYVCVLVAFVLTALVDVPKAANEQSLTPRSSPDIHGPISKLALALPQSPSLTHMQQAEALAQKLSVGFGVKFPVAVEFSDWILEASARQQMQPELIASLVFAESSFRKYAQSHVGAVGPAQVRPHYWGEFCGRLIFMIRSRKFLRQPSAGFFAGALRWRSALRLGCLQYRYELHLAAGLRYR